MIAIPGGGTQGFEVPEGVPSPLAGYSPAVRRGDWIFCAGEIPVDWMGDYMQGNNMGQPSGIAPEARVNPYYWYGSEIESQTDYRPPETREDRPICWRIHPEHREGDRVSGEPE